LWLPVHMNGERVKQRGWPPVQGEGGSPGIGACQPGNASWRARQRCCCFERERDGGAGWEEANKERRRSSRSGGQELHAQSRLLLLNCDGSLLALILYLPTKDFHVVLGKKANVTELSPNAESCNEED
jgi:hypothetical protein